MDDEFMYKLRGEPRPEFKQQLQRRLNSTMTSKPSAARRFVSWKTALAGVAGMLVVALAVSPSARALAQDFLNLFRVKRITAVSISPELVSQLRDGKLNIESVLSSSVEVLKEPAKPQPVGSVAEASQLAGIPVRVPTNVPTGMSGPDIRVSGEGVARFTADTAKLQSIVDMLGVADVTIPALLNGATVTVTKPPMVGLVYRRGDDARAGRVLFMQAHNPEIALPDGVSLPELGELALRVMGMSPDEAHRLAQSIDWTSTLLVPIPANAATFREVPVRGVTGLLIMTTGNDGGAVEMGGVNIPQGTTLLWSEGETVYAATGNVEGTTLVDMANSMQ